MDDFVSFREMVERIKWSIKRDRVWDYEVADMLGISRQNFPSCIKRNTPPIDKILKLCFRTGLDPMKICF